MFRFLLKRLANEKVVEYLSQTYVIKRAAQMTVSAMYRFSGDKNFENIFKFSRFLTFRNSFKDHLRKELKDLNRKIGKKDGKQ